MVDYTMVDYTIFSNPLFILALVIELIFKGIALWKAGRNNQIGWFVALFILNTAGLLPFIYLLFFQRNKNKSGYY
jgi:hypothetical protein